MEYLIQLKNISFSYNNKEVISNANLNIRKGDFVAIIGPNGAGKTTLVKLILGILKPTKGQVLIEGTPIEEYKNRKRISYVSQRAINFDQEFPATVYEVISLGRYIANNFNKLTENDKKKIDEALATLSLNDLKDKLIGDLSGGQQQRVFIARALASDSDIIVLDEPTSSTDIMSQEKLYNILKDLNKKGKTIIVVSHDIGTVVSYAKSILCIGKNIFKHTSKDRFNIENFKNLFVNREFILHRGKHA